VNKINSYNRSYKNSITRARNAWKDGRKVIKLTYKTFRNGVLGGLGKKMKNFPVKFLKSVVLYDALKSSTKDILADCIDEIYLANRIG